jgi:hypothetical protein
MNTTLTPRFPLGNIYMTQGISDRINMGLQINDYLERHHCGDWGDLCEVDKRANIMALVNRDRLLSAYDTPAGKIWIITEADRSITTILLPEEY